MTLPESFLKNHLPHLNYKKCKFTVFISLMTICILANAQDYQMKIYRVEDGLPSDVVKGAAQDSAGFLWIATDDGLVKFDGLRFTSFKNALHSQYAKGFYKTRSGRLLLYGDLDLVEIQNKIDTVIFKTVKPGGRNPTDSVLWYPKSIYEDSKGRLWVSEPQSVVLLEGESLQRFSFDLTDRSPQFLRSFSFFENKGGDIFVISYFGNVFKVNGSKLEKQSLTLPPNINAIVKHHKLLWIATSDAIYTFDPDTMNEPRLFIKVNDSEAIQFLDDHQMMVGTSEEYQIIVDINTKTIRDLGHHINNVNSIFLSKEQDVWISSADGLVLLQKNSFLTVDGPNVFVESITKDIRTNTVYYCTMMDLMRLKKVEGGRLLSEKLLSIPKGYFLSLEISSQGLWVANAFSVYLLKNEKIVRKWDFESEGRFVHDLFLDKDQNLWLSQSGNTFISSITPDLKVKRYKIPLLETSIVNAVRVNEDGVYVAANGRNSYLFFKTKTDSVFKSISLPVNFPLHGDFNVNDIAFTKKIMWLASSEGLLRYDGRTIERIDLGEKFSGVSVKSVEALDDDQLLFANSYGLFHFQIENQNYWLFDEGNGLASNTITSRGIFVDNEKTVWLGTSKGLSFSREKINDHKKTNTPFFVEAQINGAEKRFGNGLQMAYGSFLNLSVTSVTFPESKVALQYRIMPIQTNWRNVTKNTIALSELAAGKYTIELMARKNGGYDWSDVRTLNLTVHKPYWQRSWFLIVIIFLLGIIFWISFSIAARLNRQRRAFLERIIEQRTSELKKANEELITRNSELDRFVYSASHDLSAPLKSLLGLVNITRLEHPTPTQDMYLNMMEQSVNRMENFIGEVISYSRNARVAVQFVPINLEKLIETILSDHQYAPHFKRIEFKVRIDFDSEFYCDEMRLKIILNNLISNAIKFHQIREDRKAVIEIKAEEADKNFLITVSDNGRGIHPEMLPKIFDMFYRATDSVQGSGLGLYILKESVIKLGGDVTVKSELDAGATFTIKFPKPIR
jgi:signal transduction histidine kinase/ligand-binding sensor domain-containing protein